MGEAKKSEARFLDYSALSKAEVVRLMEGSDDDRLKAQKPISEVKAEDVRRIEPMSFFEELSCMAFLGLGVPNGIFTVPLVTYLTGKFLLGSVSTAFKGLGIILLPLVLMPQPYAPRMLKSWMAVQVLKYFSFKFIVDGEMPSQTDKGHLAKATKEHRPQILVAPPHGVFPYGNILALLVWKTLFGHPFMGLAANSALRVPIFKQILRSIGVIDAGRSSARKALENYPYTIGISTGGVAEVFETNADGECILLKSRIGLIKLAIRTGADLTPCYLFGNTKLLSCWMGEDIPGGKSVLEKLSRKLGFALILIFGRFGLPIPYRVPVLGVTGKTIPTYHIQCEEPTEEQIKTIQDQLIVNMQTMFDKHKDLYGWGDKTLTIK